MERLTKQEFRDYNNMDLHSKQMDWQSIYNRLADFEDFMDKHNFESLEDIESILTGLDLSFRTNCRLVGVNTKLKERWQKLKECVDKELQKDIKRSDLKHESFVICEQFVLDKMQELEEEE